MNAQEFCRKAWQLRKQNNPKDALIEINKALERCPENADFLNVKAIILQDLQRFDEALKFYDRALSITKNNTILNNKAICILLKLEEKRDSNELSGDDMDLINEALEILPDGENPSRYMAIKGNILFEMGQEVEAILCYYSSDKAFIEKTRRQQEIMKNSPETFIHIAGAYRYRRGHEGLHEGMIVDLIREPENVHDSDAIRVELKGEKIGYVANSPKNLIDDVKSASELKNNKSTQAEIVFSMAGTYLIAKLI